MVLKSVDGRRDWVPRHPLSVVVQASARDDADSVKMGILGSSGFHNPTNASQTCKNGSPLILPNILELYFATASESPFKLNIHACFVI